MRNCILRGALLYVCMLVYTAPLYAADEQKTPVRTPGVSPVGYTNLIKALRKSPQVHTGAIMSMEKQPKMPQSNALSHHVFLTRRSNMLSGPYDSSRHTIIQHVDVRTLEQARHALNHWNPRNHF